MVFYILCETLNKNQFVLNFVVCIVLLAMDFWTVGSYDCSGAVTTLHRLILCTLPLYTMHNSQLHVSCTFSSGRASASLFWVTSAAARMPLVDVVGYGAQDIPASVALPGSPDWYPRLQLHAD